MIDIFKLSKEARKIISECFGRLYVFFDRRCTHFRCDDTLVVKKPAIKAIWLIGEKQALIDLKESLNACGCECLKGK
jgi:hypothetical protein